MKVWKPLVNRRVKIVRAVNPDNQMYIGTLATILKPYPFYAVIKLDMPMGKLDIQTWNYPGLEPEEFTPEEIELNVREQYADQYL